MAADITEPGLVTKFREKLMLNLICDGKTYLPAVFPNEGYAKLKGETVVPRRPAPRRAGRKAELRRPGRNPAPPGAGQAAGVERHARGTPWRPGRDRRHRRTRWPAPGNSGKRNSSATTPRNQLTGLHRGQLAAELPADPCAPAARTTAIHLSRALGYGWAWRKGQAVPGLRPALRTGPARASGTSIPLTNRLFLYPPEPMTAETVISLPVAAGFMTLDGTAHVSVIGLSVRNVGSGASTGSRSGHHNLVASCTISDCTATGLRICGNAQRRPGLRPVRPEHATSRSAADGARPTEITPGHNLVANCHIYQKNFRHEKVNVGGERRGQRLQRQPRPQLARPGDDHQRQRPPPPAATSSSMSATTRVTAGRCMPGPT